jgi:glycosyltransferase involved in cell wall biosynthesis
MTASPSVSVILPTFNRADLLGRAIESVLAQSYTDWELIVWDDGSTDDTPRVAQSLHDGRIRYFGEQHHGAAYARNRAIEASGGEYLAFLDSDDEWLGGKLAIQVAALTAHDEIDVIFTDFENVDTASGTRRRTFGEYKRALQHLDIEMLDSQLWVIRRGLLEAIAIENFLATDTIALRRTVLDRVGAFDESLQSSEDFELWWRIALGGYRFAFLDGVYMLRNKPPGSLSSPSIERNLNWIRALDVCAGESAAMGRSDLLNCLGFTYGNAWQSLITEYAKVGDRAASWRAFLRSWRYGLSLGSIRLLAQALLGQDIRAKHCKAQAIRAPYCPR